MHYHENHITAFPVKYSMIYSQYGTSPPKLQTDVEIKDGTFQFINNPGEKL